MSDRTREHEDLLPLTPLTFLILAVVSEGPQHGYAVIRSVEEMGGLANPPGTGTFYSALRRMVGEGLLEAIPAPAGAEERRSRYYRITPFGRRVLTAEASRLERVIESVRPSLAGGRETS